MRYHFQYEDDSNRFIDGSVASDIPAKRIGELFNVNTYIVSQVNPHGIPFCWDLISHENQSPIQRLMMTSKKFIHAEIAHIIK